MAAVQTTIAGPNTQADVPIDALLTLLCMECKDGMYLWAEVDRVKTQLHELQATMKSTRLEQTRIGDYVLSFVTHAQLDAAMTTRVSLADAEHRFEVLRAELQSELAKKADCSVLAAQQAAKLDISVYEAGARDIKKFRTMLEQSLRDLFAGFASQIEGQVRSKLSIDDFNRIFNPESNGQKAAIENAAARIAQMNEKLEQLQVYVSEDQHRQLILTELDNHLAELGTKQTECATSLVQLQETVHDTQAQLEALDDKHSKTCETLETCITNAHASKRDQGLINTILHDKQTALNECLTLLKRSEEDQDVAIRELNAFARTALVRNMEDKLSHLNSALTREIEEVRAKHRGSTQQVTNELLRVNNKLLANRDKASQLYTTVHGLTAKLQELRSELDFVKVPLATLAANLKEENETIITEIHRSRNESREIMLDYQDLLVKEQQLQGTVPSRPITSMPTARNARSALTYVNRRTKQQKLLEMQGSQRLGACRPHTSSARVRTSSADPASITNSCAPAEVQMDSRQENIPATPRRAQTAGAAMKKEAKPALSAIQTSLAIDHLTSNQSTSISSDSRGLAALIGEQDCTFHFP